MIRQVFILTAAYLLFYYILSTYRKWKAYRENSAANRTHSTQRTKESQNADFSNVSDGEYKDIS